MTVSSHSVRRYLDVLDSEMKCFQEDTLYRLDSESVISFLEDYDRERVLIMVETGTPEFEKFEKNFCQAIKNQRVGVLRSLLGHATKCNTLQIA